MENNTLNEELEEIKNSYEDYILESIEHDDDYNHDVFEKYKTDIENQIIKIYKNNPGDEETIMTELVKIKRKSFDAYFDNIGLNNASDAKIIGAGERFHNMAIKCYNQTNSTSTLGGKNKKKMRRKYKSTKKKY